MATEPTSPPLDPQTEALMQRLEASGFFQQIRDLEENLGKISEAIGHIGKATVSRLDAMDNVLLHVLAVESIIAVMVRTHTVDRAAVKDAVDRITADLPKESQASASVLAIADGLFPKTDNKSDN
ncbi:MAG: hypothetical protein EXQ90_08410 [Rhodospirillales bacterium]|nr:hypothetical protein [Rhodospirillales bacterium]